MGLRSIKEAVRPFYLRWLYFQLFPKRRPSHFEQSWKFPAHDLPPQSSVDPEILFLPMTDWHTRIQRTQHFARTFAALGHRCFYLNPHLGREFPKPYIFSSKPRLHLLAERISELHVHLPLEPVFHERLLSPVESATIAAELAEVFERAGTQKLVQMVSFPVWMQVARQIRDRFHFPIVYDCHDELSGFRNVAEEIIQGEEEMFRTSDLVLFSARRLLVENVARFPYLATKSRLVRNAVDESWLVQTDSHRRKALPNEPIQIGYVGALDFWFDVESIAHAAALHPEWKFVLIGRVEDNRILALQRFPNVQFTGEIPHDELHPYMARFTVALIPFIRNDLTMGTNPIKLYEYFGYGLPVVGARLPELEEFGDLVYLYEGPEQFAKQLQQACAEQSAERTHQRIEVAHRESWGARVAELSRAFAALG